MKQRSRGQLSRTITPRKLAHVRALLLGSDVPEAQVEELVAKIVRPSPGLPTSEKCISREA